MNPKMAITLRAKKLGILIRDARLAANKSLRDCGAAIGVSSATVSSYERGQKSPSFPELEMISYYLKVPIEHFWKNEVISDSVSFYDDLDIEHALILRHRFIGDLLEKSRSELNISYSEIKQKTGISPTRMKKFEKGEISPPLPELELLSNVLNLSYQDYIERENEVGHWISAQTGIEEYLNLPGELQQFITKPVNRPYLDLAMKLSGLSADQLRIIAESLLDITI